MKKSIIFSIIMMIVLVLSGQVFAADETATLHGKTSVNAGEAGSVYLKIKGSEGISGVQAVVEYSGIITGVEIVGNAGFSLPGYAKGDSKFIAINANSPAEADVVQIKYTTKAEAGNGQIKVTGIQLSDGNDELIKISEPKTITITSAELKVETGEQTNNTVNNETANNTNTSNTNKNNSVIVNKGDNTVAKNEIPKTGLQTTLAVTIAVIIAVAGISYLNCRRYKNI